MTIRFQCPKCQKKFALRDELAGSLVECPCGQRLQLPSPKGSSEKASASASAAAAPGSSSPASPKKTEARSAAPPAPAKRDAKPATKPAAKPAAKPTAKPAAPPDDDDPFAGLLDEGSARGGQPHKAAIDLSAADELPTPPSAPASPFAPLPAAPPQGMPSPMPWSSGAAPGAGGGGLATGGILGSFAPPPAGFPTQVKFPPPAAASKKKAAAAGGTYWAEVLGLVGVLAVVGGMVTFMAIRYKNARQTAATAQENSPGEQNPAEAPQGTSDPANPGATPASGVSTPAAATDPSQSLLPEPAYLRHLGPEVAAGAFVLRLPQNSPYSQQNTESYDAIWPEYLVFGMEGQGDGDRYAFTLISGQRPSMSAGQFADQLAQRFAEGTGVQLSLLEGTRIDASSVDLNAARRVYRVSSPRRGGYAFVFAVEKDGQLLAVMGEFAKQPQGNPFYLTMETSARTIRPRIEGEALVELPLQTLGK